MNDNKENHTLYGSTIISSYDNNKVVLDKELFLNYIDSLNIDELLELSHELDSFIKSNNHKLKK